MVAIRLPCRINTWPGLWLNWQQISHIRRIRIHTRLPIMIPQRVTPDLCKLLANPRFQTILVIHSNHAQEFDDEVDAACLALKKAGITLLNQSVLLKHINDSSDALVALSERLFEAGVLPYYLHLLDRVSGAAHFDVPAETGIGTDKRTAGPVARVPGAETGQRNPRARGENSRGVNNHGIL